MSNKKLGQKKLVQRKLGKLGFSLLELSVVLIIISTLMVAVIKGSDLISQAKLASARQKTVDSPVLKIDGLVAWFETTLPNSFIDSEAIDNGSISIWNDSSGTNLKTPNSAIQNTAASKPTYTARAINDLPALKFDGSNDSITSSSILINSTSLEIFSVCKRISVITNGSSMTLYNSAAAYDYNNAESVVFAYESSGSILQTYRIAAKSTATHPGNDTPYIFSTKFDGTNNTSYLNGVAQAAVASSGTFKIDRIMIGTRLDSGSARYNGYVAEIIIYNRVLSTQERRDIEQYLSDKYQIPVS